MAFLAFEMHLVEIQDLGFCMGSGRLQQEFEYHSIFNVGGSSHKKLFELADFTARPENSMRTKRVEIHTSESRKVEMSN